MKLPSSSPGLEFAYFLFYYFIMPYREPIFFEGGYYHIYSRGSEKRQIFLDRADYQRFLKRLEEYKDKHDVSVLCYCLMPNHYHLLIKQNTQESISHFIYRLNLAYAMYFNKRYERVGPLFQGRFKAKNVSSDEYLVHLSRYIHLNPLSPAQTNVENYPWSSLQIYLERKNDDLVDLDLIKSYFGFEGQVEKYLKFIKEEGERKFKSAMEDLLFEEITPLQVRDLKRAE